MSRDDSISAELEALRVAYRRLEDRFNKVLGISDRYGALARSLANASAIRVPNPEMVKRAESNAPGASDALIGRLKTRLGDASIQSDPLLLDVSALLKRYEKLDARMNKIVTISDSYQAQLRALLTKVEAMAHTDVLTGLFNRRAMMDQLELEEARAERYGEFFSLILFDVDDFKNVNDTYGHAAGDEVLKRVAVTLADSLRRSDVCARWGGEEFLVLFPETDSVAAAAAGEKCRKAVSDLRFESFGNDCRTTISGGLCSYEPGRDLTQLLKFADSALYRAKSRGKNRIESATDLT